MWEAMNGVAEKTKQIMLFGEPSIAASVGTPVLNLPQLGGLRSKRSQSTYRLLPRDTAEIRYGDVWLYKGDVLPLYEKWERPTVIIVDGPYGINGFPGDPPTADNLCEWYEPHVKEWSRLALPSATMWFWGTELGWATVAIVPWFLTNLISGRPKAVAPFIESAKYAAEYRNWHWQHKMKKQPGVKTDITSPTGEGVRPYPPDKGQEFGQTNV
jgi:hypothetical protein